MEVAFTARFVHFILVRYPWEVSRVLLLWSISHVGVRCWHTGFDPGETNKSQYLLGSEDDPDGS